MSGVRVSNIPREASEKELHAYFANPSHGGGKIKSIHYPVISDYSLRDEAVIIFEEVHTAESLEQVGSHHNGHKIGDEKVFVRRLPQLQVFTKLEAQLDPAVSAFLQTTEEARDEIIHHGELKYRHDNSTDLSYMTGTWYQLEWAWKYLEIIMNQQQKALTKSSYMKNTGIDIRVETMRQEQGDRRMFTKGYIQDDRAGMVKYGADGSVQLAKGASRIPGDEERILVPTERDDNADDDDVVQITETIRNVTFIDKEKDKTEVQRKLHRGISEVSVRDPQTKDKMTRSISVEDKDSRDLRSLEFQCDGLKVSLYTGDITLSETDVIVNAGMDSRLGVSYAITQAAGRELLYELDDHFRRHGKFDTGDVMYTSAGGKLHSNVKYVIHTVGPIWTADLAQDVGEYQLTRTFLNCLDLANRKLKTSSIVFPAISTGSYCGTVDVCAKCFLDAILLFTYGLQGKLHIKEISLVNKHEDSTANMVLFLRQHLKKGMDLLTIEASDEYERLKRKIEKKPGLIAKVKAEVADFIKGTSKESEEAAYYGKDVGKKTGAQKNSTTNRPLPKVPTQTVGQKSLTNNRPLPKVPSQTKTKLSLV